MIEGTKIEVQGLNEFVGVFQRVLKITSRDAVQYQSGRIMDRLGKELPPDSRDKARKKATWQVRKSFYWIKRGSGVYDLTGNKPLFKGDQAKGKNTVWLYASPEILVGVGTKNDKRGVDASQMISMHKVQRNRTEKNRWMDGGILRRRVGREQRAMIVNKPVVRASQAKAFIKKVHDSFGKLKASFLKGRNSVGSTVKISVPAIAAKHLEDSKGSFVPVRPNDVSPSTIIISQSPGCEHPAALKTILGVVTRQRHAMKKDIDLYLRGIKSASDFRRKHGFQQFMPGRN